MSESERSATNLPGRMHSPWVRHSVPLNPRSFEELDPGGFAQPACFPGEGSSSLRSDPELFRLSVEFADAHGLPKGQVTTFLTVV
jgi:hypothetical protein